MTLQEIIDLSLGQEFSYENSPAKVLWTDKLEYLIVKGDSKAKIPYSDVYFRSYSVYFSVEGREPITLTTMHPVPRAIEMPEFQY